MGPCRSPRRKSFKIFQPEIQSELPLFIDFSAPRTLSILFQAMSTIIVGAGIIGSATAFYLTQEPSTTPADSIHIIESSPELFASASGFAAGFLARDWFSRSTASLGALSFDLHNELAEKHRGAQKWGYSRSTSTSFARDPLIHGEHWVESGSRANVAGDVHESRPSHLPSWLKRRGTDELDVIGTDENTAQVYLATTVYSLCPNF